MRPGSCTPFPQAARWYAAALALPDLLAAAEAEEAAAEAGGGGDDVIREADEEEEDDEEDAEDGSERRSGKAESDDVSGVLGQRAGVRLVQPVSRWAGRWQWKVHSAWGRADGLMCVSLTGRGFRPCVLAPPFRLVSNHATQLCPPQEPQFEMSVMRAASDRDSDAGGLGGLTRGCRCYRARSRFCIIPASVRSNGRRTGQPVQPVCDLPCARQCTATAYLT